MDEEQERRRPAARMRLSPEKRAKFLEVLGQTGNRSAAAAAIGVEPRLMDQRRRFDPLLDRQWDEAIEQSQRRLAGANGPLDCIGGAEPMVIRRGKSGRLKLVKAGQRRWSGPVEENFFATLASCGNIAASARAVGFSESCIHQRRRKWPAFAERLDEALEDAEYEVEFQVAAEVRRMSRAKGPSQAGIAETDRFDMDAAIRFLKWRDEKRQGYGRRGRSRKGPPDRTIEEARASIRRKIEAIERHENRRRLAEGWSQDEEGRMIPPGWVRAGAERGDSH
jgi:hypothetical protein